MARMLTEGDQKTGESKASGGGPKYSGSLASAALLHRSRILIRFLCGLCVFLRLLLKLTYWKSTSAVNVLQKQKKCRDARETQR